MPCYHPLAGWQTLEGEINFYSKLKRRTTERNQALNYRRDLDLPCGRCIGCRLERSKQWAVRIMHEAQLHERNAFITLTYNKESLDEKRNGTTSENTRTLLAHENTDSVIKRDVQLFMKRLRKDQSSRGTSTGSEQPVSSLGVNKLKYYAIGEYGETHGRPHYHAALFGENFEQDRYPWKKSQSGKQTWRSPRLEKLWTAGNCDIGELEFDSAAYIARYIMKKINGTMADEHYRRVDPNTGEYIWIEPEFALMSRGGRTGKGIGAGWLDRHQEDVYPNDYVVVNGRKLKPPRFYDKLMEALEPELVAQLKLEREKKALDGAADNTPARRAVKEAVTTATLNQRKRQ